MNIICDLWGEDMFGKKKKKEELEKTKVNKPKVKKRILWSLAPDRYAIKILTNDEIISGIIPMPEKIQELFDVEENKSKIIRVNYLGGYYNTKIKKVEDKMCLELDNEFKMTVQGYVHSVKRDVKIDGGFYIAFLKAATDIFNIKMGITEVKHKNTEENKAKAEAEGMEKSKEKIKTEDDK